MTNLKELKELDGFNPDWKCKDDCVANEVIKEWLKHGLAPKKDLIRVIELAEYALIEVNDKSHFVPAIVQNALSEIRKLKGE